MSILERKLIRDIGRRKAQFVAIVATVLLGVALFGASYDAYQNLLASYDELFVRTNFAALTIEGGDPEAVAASVADQPGVAAVAARTTADLPVEVDGSRLLGRMVGLPAGGRAAVDDVLVLEGSYLDPGDPSGVLVERHMADHFGLAPGDPVRVYGASGWQELTVRGIAASAEYIWPARSRQEVLTLPDQFGVIFAPQPLLDSLPAGVTTPQVLVTYQGPADDPALTRRARHARGGGRRRQRLHPRRAAVERRTRRGHQRLRRALAPLPDHVPHRGRPGHLRPPQSDGPRAATTDRPAAGGGLPAAVASSPTTWATA